MACSTFSTKVDYWNCRAHRLLGSLCTHFSARETGWRNTSKKAVSRRKLATDQHHLLRDADQSLGRWVVEDGSVKINSPSGLRSTIGAVISVWEQFEEVGCEDHCTLSFNPDALDNLLGTTRQRGTSGNWMANTTIQTTVLLDLKHDHPDPTQFRFSTCTRSLWDERWRSCRPRYDGFITRPVVTKAFENLVMMTLASKAVRTCVPLSLILARVIESSCAIVLCMSTFHLHVNVHVHNRNIQGAS